MRKLICLVCPNGCEMEAEMVGGEVRAAGALCRRGREFARKELTASTRTFATSVRVKDGDLPLVSVRTLDPLPTELLGRAREELKQLCLAAPVRVGDQVANSLLGLPCRVIATRNVDQA